MDNLEELERAMEALATPRNRYFANQATFDKTSDFFKSVAGIDLEVNDLLENEQIYRVDMSVVHGDYIPYDIKEFGEEI